MHIKDAMREHSIGEVADAWYRLVEAYRSKNPGLAAMVLATMQRYIPWIDITLVANDKCVRVVWACACVCTWGAAPAAHHTALPAPDKLGCRGCLGSLGCTVCHCQRASVPCRGAQRQSAAQLACFSSKARACGLVVGPAWLPACPA